MAIIWNVLPISFILYSNFMVYRKIPKTIPKRNSGVKRNSGHRMKADDASSQGQWYKETQLNLMNQPLGSPGAVTSYSTSTNRDDLLEFTEDRNSLFEKTIDDRNELMNKSAEFKSNNQS